MILFDAEKHIYIDEDGVIIPSVTQCIGNILGNKYEYVPNYILKNAGDYGTKVHKLIEMLENGEEIECDTVYEENAIKQYKKVKDFESIYTEFLIEYNGIYCGTCDGVGKDVIYDIKPTSKLDKDYVILQLSLYLLAYDEDYYDEYKGYCIWLPKKGIGKKVEIELYSKKDVLKMVELINLL